MPQICVLDNAADIFAGNENDRAQVRQFIALLHGMALSAGCGVLLTSHPSLTGISSGTGLSGSTAWNASVRSRLYFKRATTEKDEEPDPDLRVLEVMKSNYGPVGERLMLRWADGLFGLGPQLSDLERAQRAVEADHLITQQLKRDEMNLSNNPRAVNYAPRIFAKTAEAKELGVTERDLEAAMQRLLTAGKIKVQRYGVRLSRAFG